MSGRTRHPWCIFQRMPGGGYIIVARHTGDQIGTVRHEILGWQAYFLNREVLRSGKAGVLRCSCGMEAIRKVRLHRTLGTGGL